MEGRVISHFRVLARIGEGGMGVVYKAVDEALRRPVALKVLPPEQVEDSDRRERFLREARAAAAVSHPAVTSIYEVGEEGGVVFIAMEYVEGRTLRAVLEQSRLGSAEALRITAAIAQGLERAHAAGVIHRDLKPENVMLRPDGQIKILDFGLAKWTREQGLDGAGPMDETKAGLTREGMVLGTANYMSPEQARGGAVDARTDLFSLGVILYEMLTCRKAFRGATVIDTIGAILRDRPPDASLGNPDVSPEVSALVERLLAKSAAERMPSARALLEALRSLQPRAETASAASPSIAVLPFRDMSPGKDQDYFCEGIAEELIGALATIDGLRVAARSSSFQFKGRAEDVRRIGEALSVASVLEGSVRVAGRRLRVAVQLIGVADGYQIWSETYDRDLDDVFAVQDEIASSTVKALRDKLGRPALATPAPHAAPDLDAYRLYLRGRYLVDRYHLDEGMECFRQAAARDVRYAAPHAALAECHVRLGSLGNAPARPAYSAARAEAETALALDPGAAAACAALAVVRWLEWDFAGSEELFRRAIKMGPRQPLSHLWYAQTLALAARPDDALEVMEAGHAVDPLSPLVTGLAATVCHWAGADEKAIAFAEAALEMEPAARITRTTRGLALLALCRPQEALAELETAGAAPEAQAYCQACLGWAYAVTGQSGAARLVLAGLLERQRHEYVAPEFPAWVHAGLLETDEAFACLDRQCDDRGFFLTGLKVLRFFENLRVDPRFAKLVSRVGLPL